MKLFRSRKFDKETDMDSVLTNLHRLSAVNATGLVDLPQRPDLELLAKTASERLGVSKAQVTVIDDHRQIVPVRFGADAPPAGSEQESLDYSYCKYVVAYDEALVVEDALEDPLVKDNLSTTVNGLRSYIGVPLRARGEIIGSFCVFDNEPHEWSEDDLQQLQEVAEEVMRQIDSESTNDEGSGGHFGKPE